MAPLGKLTEPRMQQYADKHHFEFRCFKEFPPNTPAYWEKMVHVIRAFNDGINRVIWLDADQCITNFEVVPPFTHGFTASMDWGKDALGPQHFSMCGFVAFPDSKYLFEWVIANKEFYIRQPFPEQMPMREQYALLPNMANMNIVPRKVFNAVPKEVDESVVEPWDRKCLAAHITMKSIPERVAIFHQILQQI